MRLKRYILFAVLPVFVLFAGAYLAVMLNYERSEAAAKKRAIVEAALVSIRVSLEQTEVTAAQFSGVSEALRQTDALLFVSLTLASGETWGKLPAGVEPLVQSRERDTGEWLLRSATLRQGGRVTVAGSSPATAYRSFSFWTSTLGVMAGFLGLGVLVALLLNRFLTHELAKARVTLAQAGGAKGTRVREFSVLAEALQTLATVHAADQRVAARAEAESAWHEAESSQHGPLEKHGCLLCAVSMEDRPRLWALAVEENASGLHITASLPESTEIQCEWTIAAGETGLFDGHGKRIKEGRAFEIAATLAEESPVEIVTCAAAVVPASGQPLLLIRPLRVD